MRRVGSVLVAAGLAALSLVPGSPARADTAPAAGLPATVSADVLPTPQIDGVAWAQVVSGSRVYVVGRFSKARPFGAAPGTGEVARSNALAYDVNTGVLTDWAPKLNAQGLGVAASPDGSRIYLAGEFTQVDGVTRARVAAVSAATGALVANWAPALNSRARALVVTGATVFVGGGFTTANGVPAGRLVALSASSGGTRPIPMTANDEVFAIALPPGNPRMVVGGRFTKVNNTVAYGLAAVSPSTGASMGMPANAIIKNSGVNSAIYSLATDGTRVYGSGYRFTDSATGNLEGTFATSAATGKLDWVNGCLGDTYSVWPVGPVLYSVGHAHDCRQIGWFPEQTPRQFQRAGASTIVPSGQTNTIGPLKGQPHSTGLHWLPYLDVGTVTGQSQAAWTVTGTSKYVLIGGEFPKVNNKAQQGLARFAVSSVAPNKEGPRYSEALTPTLVPLSEGTVRVNWTTTYDRDNKTLRYEVLRNSVVVATMNANAAWWNTPAIGWTDTTAPSGTTQAYRIRVQDPFGNVLTSPSVSVTVP